MPYSRVSSGKVRSPASMWFFMSSAKSRYSSGPRLPSRSEGSKRCCILILEGISKCDRFEVRSVDPQVRNPGWKLTQDPPLATQPNLPPILCGMWTSVTNTNHLATYPVHTNFKETTNGSSVRSAKKNLLPIFVYKKNKLFFTSGQIKKLSLLLEKINKMFRYFFLNPPPPPQLSNGPPLSMEHASNIQNTLQVRITLP